MARAAWGQWPALQAGGLLHGCTAIHGPCSLGVSGPPSRRTGNGFGSSGLPMPREPAYVDKRSQDGEAQATSE
jgi:hypothetical protein